MGIDLPDTFAQAREAGYLEAMDELGQKTKGLPIRKSVKDSRKVHYTI